MFTEFLKIKPLLDNASLNKLVKSLNSRFAAVAKKFGKGLVDNASKMLRGGAIIGALGFIIAKLLDPIKQVEEGIRNALTSADDTVTLAKQFESSPGKLFKLQQIGVATGFQPEQLQQMMIKFQTSLAEARAGKKNPLTNFIGEKDTVEAFAKYIASMQKLSSDQQVLINGQIFGERMLGKMADFLQADIPQMLKQIGGPSVDKLTPRLEKLDRLNNLIDLGTAQRNINDISTKSRLISSGTVSAINASMQKALDKENERLRGFKEIKATSNAIQELTTKVETILLQLTSFLPKVTAFITKFQDSKFLRGIFSILGGK